MKYFSIIFLLLPILLFSTTYHVNQNGNMDFTIIQDAVDATISGDSIIVYPGTYVENIEIFEKGITLTSLYFTNQDTTYIHNTILDGDQSGSVIRVEDSNDEEVVIQGFTIQNGSGTLFDSLLGEKRKGGGIFLGHSNSVIIANIIRNNICKYGNGGGIQFEYSYGSVINNTIVNNKCVFGIGGGISFRRDPNVLNIITYLNGNIITNNSAGRYGGGINIPHHEVIFDSINLNQIYSNHGINGKDIRVFIDQEDYDFDIDIYLGKFTVNNPKDFEGRYISYSRIDASPEITNDYIFSTNESVIDEFIEQDVYVSLDGDDNNDGLTPETPFKTIFKATSMLKADTLNTHTIHLASGVYDESNQFLPVSLYKAMNISGDQNGETLIAGNFDHTSCLSNYDVDYLKTKISNINFSTQYYGKTIYFSSELYTEDVGLYEVENCKIVNSDGSAYIHHPNIEINNLEIDNSRWELSLSNGHYQGLTNINVANSIFKNSYGRATPDIFTNNGSIIASFTNCLFHNNEYNDYGMNYMGNGITMNGPNDNYFAELNVVNCTFADNYVFGSDTGAIALHAGQVEANIYNSIFWNNSAYDINAVDSSANQNQDYIVNIYNSSFTDGLNSINISDNTELSIQDNFDDFIGDPLFVDPESGYPEYSLRHDSPFIDKGSVALPEHLEIPEFDLAGNPRIWGDDIDLGAYEWQGTGIEEEVEVVKSNIKTYPNPFRPRVNRSYCSIQFNIEQAGKVEVAVYNLKGQKVKEIMNAYSDKGKFDLHWNGRNEAGNLVASGQYFVKMKQHDQVIAKKMMIVK